jgi:hypothetical protein
MKGGGSRGVRRSRSRGGGGRAARFGYLGEGDMWGPLAVGLGGSRGVRGVRRSRRSRRGGVREEGGGGYSSGRLPSLHSSGRLPSLVVT